MTSLIYRCFDRALSITLVALMAPALCTCATVATPSDAPTTAPTFIPTTVPTVAAPTTVPPTAVIPVEADAPGPGWVFALSGDANRDGVADAVFYRPAAVAPEIQFDDPARAAVAVAAREIVVVQRSAVGLETLLQIDLGGGWADRPLFDFVGRRSPAGYLLALDPALGPLFTLLPYGAGGIDSGGLIGIDWNPGEGAFRLVAERP